eukprot:scaffold252020_cov28-Tisochrysis_lutea.AAC.6
MRSAQQASTAESGRRARRPTRRRVCRHAYAADGATPRCREPQPRRRRWPRERLGPSMSPVAQLADSGAAAAQHRRLALAQRLGLRRPERRRLRRSCRHPHRDSRRQPSLRPRGGEPPPSIPGYRRPPRRAPRPWLRGAGQPARMLREGGAQSPAQRE